MRRILTIGLLLSSFLLGLANAGYAQFTRDFELNIFGGGTISTNKHFEIGFPQSTTPIEGQFRLDKGLRGGLRVNVYTRGHWGEEFFYSYEPNTTHFTRQTTPASSLNLTIQVHNLGVNAMYYLNEDETRRVRPFLSVGLGASVFRPTAQAQAIARDPLRGNVKNLATSNELALNYGAGVKARLKSWVGFRMDLRGFLARNPSFGLARESSDPNTTVFPVSGVIQTGEASAGLIFYFGKR